MVGLNPNRASAGKRAPDVPNADFLAHLDFAAMVCRAYNPETDTWRTISGGPRFGMVGTEAAWGDGALFTWNGTEEGLDAIYRPDTDSWERVTEEGAPVRRAGAHVHGTGDGFLIWGGGASVDTPFPHLDGGIFSP